MPLPLFGKSHKSPPDIVKNLKEALTSLDKNDPKKSEKAAEEVSRWLQAVKLIIYGQEGQEPHVEQVIKYDSHMLLCSNFEKLIVAVLSVNFLTTYLLYFRGT